MTDLDQLDRALEQHLHAVSRHVDPGLAEVAGVHHRATRIRRRRAAVRGGLVVGCLVLLAGVVVLASLDDRSTPVDTADDPTPADDRERSLEVVPFDETGEAVGLVVRALDTTWGLALEAGATGLDGDALVRSDDGVTWVRVDDVPIEGFTLLAGREDLLVLASRPDRSIVVQAFDGRQWGRSTVPAPPEAELTAVGVAGSHVQVIVRIPPVDEVEWRRRSVQVDEQLTDRFGEFDSTSVSTGSGPPVYSILRGDELLASGTADELGVDDDLLETLFTRPAGGPGRFVVYVSADEGASWMDGDAPPSDPGVGIGSEIGLVTTTPSGFAVLDGARWQTVDVDGMEADEVVTGAVRGDGYVLLVTDRRIARAERVDGPYETVVRLGDPRGSLGAAAGPRGAVVIETTLVGGEDGVDSEAEAESLDLPASAAPEIRHRVLASPDGKRFDELDLELGAGPTTSVITYAAPDGWLVVRGWAEGADQFRLGPGHRIDPGG